MTTGLVRWAALSGLMALCAQSAFAQRTETMTWNVDGQAREAIVYSPPANSSATAAPLVFCFHGHGDTVQNFQHTGLHRAWPEAIVVYVQGLPGSDGLSGWQVEKGADGDRDLRLIDTALASLRRAFYVDDDRIYATGFSNGANFTYLLWVARAEKFAAFAPVAGRLRSASPPTQPRSILHVAGTQDTIIPFARQQTAIETAKHVNGVTGRGASCGDGCTIYGASGSHPLMTWIHAGAHEYPAGASQRIADFFRDHSRPTR